MAIASYLDDFDADPETKRVLHVALEMTRAALGLADDFANGIIAKQIVELARAGERHPDVLCEGVVRLSGEERERLETLLRKGKSPARRVLKARILLKADVSEAGKGWSDNRIIEALETS